jgi:hypothetical protein
MWTCDKCGSEKVEQEFAFYRPMNDRGPFAPDYLNDAINAWQNDFYWCVDCEDECSPVKSVCNSLHKDYEPS